MPGCWTGRHGRTPGTASRSASERDLDPYRELAVLGADLDAAYRAVAGRLEHNDACPAALTARARPHQLPRPLPGQQHRPRRWATQTAARPHRIRHLTGPATSLAHDPAALLLKARYEAALRAAGIRLDPRLVVTDLRTSEDAQAALTDLMTAADPPTAVFACRNILSIGAIRALHSLGLSHPCRPRGLRRLPARRPHEPAAYGDPPRHAVHRSAGRRAVVHPDRGRPFPLEASGEHTHAGRPGIRRDPTVQRPGWMIAAEPRHDNGVTGALQRLQPARRVQVGRVGERPVEVE